MTTKPPDHFLHPKGRTFNPATLWIASMADAIKCNHGRYLMLLLIYGSWVRRDIEIMITNMMRMVSSDNGEEVIQQQMMMMVVMVMVMVMVMVTMMVMVMVMVMMMMMMMMNKQWPVIKRTLLKDSMFFHRPSFQGLLMTSSHHCLSQCHSPLPIKPRSVNDWWWTSVVKYINLVNLQNFPAETAHPFRQWLVYKGNLITKNPQHHRTFASFDPLS